MEPRPSRHVLQLPQATPRSAFQAKIGPAPTSLPRKSARWKKWQRRRLKAMIDYATGGSDCRRVVVGKHFGDDVADCTSRDIVAVRHVCDGQSQHRGRRLPDHLVADPELLSTRSSRCCRPWHWASEYRSGSYGEASLRAAVLGKESLGEGRPLGQGVLSCPQFGALRHVRNGERRWDDAVSQLLEKGLVERRSVQREGSHSSYQTLVLTALGAQTLGVPLKTR